MEIKFIDIDNDGDILKCFDIINQLIENLKENELLSIIKRKYKMWYKIAILKESNQIISFIWIRPYEYFGCWEFLIIDDFVTDKDFRWKWYWTQLFNWIIKYAKDTNYSQIQLDSNIELEKAHNFYKKIWLKFSHKHFSIIL